MIVTSVLQAVRSARLSVAPESGLLPNLSKVWYSTSPLCGDSPHNGNLSKCSKSELHRILNTFAVISPPTYPLLVSVVCRKLFQEVHHRHDHGSNSVCNCASSKGCQQTSQSARHPQHIVNPSHTILVATPPRSAEARTEHTAESGHASIVHLKNHQVSVASDICVLRWFSSATSHPTRCLNTACHHSKCGATSSASRALTQNQGCLASNGT